jgi:hypothetical protein
MWEDSPTRSRPGPTSIEFHPKEYLEGQFVKPSWCLLVQILKPGGQFGFTVVKNSSIFHAIQAVGQDAKWAPYIKVHGNVGYKSES